MVVLHWEEFQVLSCSIITKKKKKECVMEKILFGYWFNVDEKIWGQPGLKKEEMGSGMLRTTGLE